MSGGVAALCGISRWSLNRKSGLTRFAALAGALLVCSACDRLARSTGVSGVARDSAGIRIVEHASIPKGMPLWSLEPPPTLSIGAVEGDSSEVFGNVIGVSRLSDGNVVALDGQAQHLSAFTSSGKLVWTAGGPGEGPGEFRSLSRGWLLPGDSLLAVDLGRLSVFDQTGTYIRTSTLRSPAPAVLRQPVVTGVLEDGTLVAAFPIISSVRPEGRFRGWRAHALITPHGDVLTGLGTFPGAETIEYTNTFPLPNREVITTTSYASTQVSRRTMVSAAGDRVVIGDQARFELLYYGADGSLEMIVRVASPARKVDREKFERNRGPCPAAGCWQFGAVPDTLPAFGRIVLDPDGRLWVEEFVPEYETRTAQWWILGPNGEFLASVEPDPGFTPHQVRGDEVVGVRLDDLDVSYVELWSIDRGGT